MWLDRYACFVDSNSCQLLSMTRLLSMQEVLPAKISTVHYAGIDEPKPTSEEMCTTGFISL